MDVTRARWASGLPNFQEKQTVTVLTNYANVDHGGRRKPGRC